MNTKKAAVVVLMMFMISSMASAELYNGTYADKDDAQAMVFDLSGATVLELISYMGLIVLAWVIGYVYGKVKKIK